MSLNPKDFLKNEILVSKEGPNLKVLIRHFLYTFKGNFIFILVEF